MTDGRLAVSHRRVTRAITANVCVLVGLIVASLWAYHGQRDARSKECRTAGALRAVIQQRRTLDARAAKRSAAASAYWLHLAASETDSVTRAFISSDAGLRSDSAQDLTHELRVITRTMRSIGC